MFRVQTNMFGRYHITDPGNFYNRTDAWEIAQQPGVTGTVTPGRRRRHHARAERRRWPGRRAWSPTTCSCACPARSEEDFLILQPFVPFSRDDSRKDLTAFMVAKSDPRNYGRLEAFVMPRARQIDGPAIVNARINQQPEISQQITLLSTAGSNVKLGNLLVIPINQSLIYIQPLYVQAAGHARAPAEEGDRGRRRPGGHARLAAGGADRAVRLVAAHARAPGGRARPPARPSPAAVETPPGTGTPPAVDATVAGLLDAGQRPLHRRRRGPPAGRPGRSTSRSWTRPRPSCARPPTPPGPRPPRPPPPPPRRPEPPPEV